VQRTRLAAEPPGGGAGRGLKTGARDANRVSRPPNRSR